MPVSHCDVEYWVVAAGWLGRMHGYFAQQLQRLNECEFLIQHNADFFWLKAELALRDVSEISTPLARRLSKIVMHYDRIVTVMTSQPPTLLHGGYRPSNVLVKIDSDSQRVCTIDWEEAAVGAPLFDLAYLADGFQSPTLDLVMNTYRQEALGYGLSLPDREEMVHIVNCFRMYMLINLLARSVISNWPERSVAKLVCMAEQLACTVF